MLPNFDYDAFGKKLGAGSAATDYLFAGEQWDPNIRSLYLRSRNYDVANGRFQERDTFPNDLADTGNSHRYVYSKNNSVNFIDPSGRLSIAQLVVGSAILGTLSYVGFRGFKVHQTYKRMLGDARSAAVFASLDSNLRTIALLHMDAIGREGIDARLVSGHRTYAAQDALYAQGRTAPGNIVTNARGGFSNHNFAVAYDIGVFEENGNYVDDGEDARYLRAGEIGKELKLTWGGDFTTIRDTPHFEFPHGLSSAELRRRVEAGEPILPSAADILLYFSW